MKVLVTGGTGYIGSHTIVDLDENGFETISIDNGSRSRVTTIDAINKITAHKIENTVFDLCDKASLFSFFEQQKDIKGLFILLHINRCRNLWKILCFTTETT
jgi:UDP-glucose 4-epimerase